MHGINRRQFKIPKLTDFHTIFHRITCRRSKNAQARSTESSHDVRSFDVLYFLSQNVAAIGIARVRLVVEKTSELKNKFNLLQFNNVTVIGISIATTI